MKVIEKNNRIKCECGCTFEYDANDVKEEYCTSGGIFLHPMYYVSYVKCPVCLQKHEIRSVFKGYC